MARADRTTWRSTRGRTRSSSAALASSRGSSTSPTGTLKNGDRTPGRRRPATAGLHCDLDRTAGRTDPSSTWMSHFPHSATGGGADESGADLGSALGALGVVGGGRGGRRPRLVSGNKPEGRPNGRKPALKSRVAHPIGGTRGMDKR